MSFLTSKKIQRLMNRVDDLERELDKYKKETNKLRFELFGKVRWVKRPLNSYYTSAWDYEKDYLDIAEILKLLAEHQGVKIVGPETTHKGVTLEAIENE